MTKAWLGPDQAFSVIVGGKASGRMFVRGHLSFDSFPGELHLPEGLYVNGDLILSRTSVRELPKGLVVVGDLLLEFCREFRSVAWPLRAHSVKFKHCRRLELVQSSVRAFGEVSFEGCTKLKAVAGSITAEEINFHGCRSLAQLPKRIEASRIVLTGCSSLRSIDPTLARQSLVVVDGRTMAKPDETLALSGPWALRLLLAGRLPPGRRLEGLHVENRNDVETLPERTRVAKSLSLKDCRRLRALPATLQVDDTLTLQGSTPSVPIPPGLKYKSLRLSDGSKDDKPGDGPGCLLILLLLPYYAVKAGFKLARGVLRSRPMEVPYHAKGVLPEDAKRNILTGRAVPDPVEGELVIEALPELTELETLTVRGTLWLRRLPRLKRLRNVRALGRIVIQDCPELEDFAGVVSRSIEISGALRLERLTGLTTDSLSLHRCDSIAEITDVSSFQRLTVTTCAKLRSIAGEFEGERLELRGLPLLEVMPASVNTGEIQLSDLPALKGLPPRLQYESATFTQLPWLEGLPANLLLDTLVVAKCQNFKALPPRLAVAYEIQIEDCASFETIPPETTCHDFRLLGGQVRSIDTKWRSMRSLVVRTPTLIRLPQTLGCVDLLDLAGCSDLQELPSGLTVSGPLDLRGCEQLRGIPAQMPPPERAELGGTRLQEVPATWSNAPLFWHQVPVSARILYNASSIPPSQVLAETNVEIRRVLIERIGLSNLVRAVEAEVVHEDTDAGGPRKLLRIRSKAREDILVLSVVCPSTGRNFILRVPPTVQSCHAAAAALAGLAPEHYNPVQET